MTTIKMNTGFELPVSITMSEGEARKLYATLSLVAQQPEDLFPCANRIQAVKLMDDINKIFMGEA